VIIDILAEIRRGWGDATRGEKLHATWALVNDVGALVLVVLTLSLFVASTGPGFPTDAWLSMILIAVLWVGSIVSIDPVIGRLVDR
jgi:hypothetical protein